MALQAGLCYNRGRILLCHGIALTIRDVMKERQISSMTDSVSSPSKLCKRCQETKPFSEFYTSAHSGNICKACISLYQKSRVQLIKTSDRPILPSSKKCRQCTEEKDISLFKKDSNRKGGYSSLCKACHNACYTNLDPEVKERLKQKKAVQRRGHLGYSKNYDEMFALQDGRCAACGNPPETGKRLARDHDHETGEARGLLCTPCNLALGLLRDDHNRVSGLLRYIQIYTA